MAADKINDGINPLPSYKGKPLVRSGNTLYYGNPSEKCIAMLQVLSNKSLSDMDLSDKVTVQIILTDENIHTSNRIIKKTEKFGLYNALNIASIWLDRALTEKK